MKQSATVALTDAQVRRALAEGAEVRKELERRIRMMHRAPSHYPGPSTGKCWVCGRSWASHERWCKYASR